MRIDVIWNQEATSVDLAEGLATVGGSPNDGICIEGLPHGLLTLRLDDDQLSVTAARSVRIGGVLFPARVSRLLVEGEDLKLPNGVIIRRVVDAKKRDSRKLVATAFVAQELLSGVPSPQDTRAATLTCVTGLDRGRVYPIPFDDNLIGRADGATIRIRDRAVSRHHARLVRQGTDYALELVTSSMNGVYVNSRLVRKRQAMRTGDLLELGQTMLRFQGAEAAPEERTVLLEAEQQSPPILEPAPIAVPLASELPPTIDFLGSGLRTGLPQKLLVAAGGVLAALGALGAALASKTL